MSINEIVDFIGSYGFNDIIINDKTLDIDIYIPSKNLAIQYSGIYTHSETCGSKTRYYHRDKYIKCKDNGIKLLTIFDSEWNTKNSKIKSLICHKLGKTSIRIPARKTFFKQVEYSRIKKFEQDNHLQGTRPGKYYYALYYNGEVVMAISIGIPRFNNKHKYELIRMTTKNGISVIGGMSKLFSNIDHSDIITYADIRFGDGESYEKIGFIKKESSGPNYFYFHKSDTNKLYTRNRFQKHKIPNVIKEKSEYENMLLQGYDRIWDCGNSVYIYYK